MNFYKISFQGATTDLRMKVNSREGSVWVDISADPDPVKGDVTFHISPRDADRFRAACAAFNAEMEKPAVKAPEPAPVAPATFDAFRRAYAESDGDHRSYVEYRTKRNDDNTTFHHPV